MEIILPLKGASGYRWGGKAIGKKKTKQTVDYTQITPHDTPDITAARSQINNINLTDPINQAYGQATNDVQNQTFEDTLPDSAANRVRTSQLFNLDVNKGRDLASATAQQEALKSGQALSLAGLTSPRILQSGGQMTQSGATLGDWLGVGGAVTGGFGTAYGGAG